MAVRVVCAGGGGEKSAEIMLLTPSSSEVDAATTFVEHVKTDFPTMVNKWPWMYTLSAHIVLQCVSMNVRYHPILQN